MADNTRINVGAGGDLIATDDVSGVKYQRIKVSHGADGSASDVSSTAPFPVRIYHPVGGFGDVRVVEKTPVLSVNAALPLSDLRNETATAGSATIDATTSPGEVALTLTASGTDSATLSTRRVGNYTPGFAGEVGIGVRRPTAPTGSQTWRAGLYDANNGFFLEETASGLQCVVRSNGADTEVARASWNVDALDGNGDSGVTLDLTSGVILEIDFTYYGYGLIEFAFVIDSATGQERYVAHRASVSGVSVQNPNLPVRADASNGGTASAFSLFVGGRQYSVIGRDYSEQRITAVSRLELGSIDTTVVPLIGVRRNTSNSFRAQSGVDGFDIVADADLVISLWLNPTSLTSASWGTPAGIPTTDTLLQADTSATAISGGQKLWEGMVGGGSRSSSSIASFDPIDVGASGTLVLAARRISGTNATASATLRMFERW